MTATAETTRSAPVRSAADGWVRSIPFDPRHNSLNLIRLFLAFAVLLSHSFPLGGWGKQPYPGGNTIGGWAVAGFFLLSGYLVFGSRVRTTAGVYLIHRVARIFPAFLVCLVVTAFVFAPVAYLVENGTLDGFLTTPTTPMGHVWSNAFLQINVYGISGTLADAPFPNVWNGSLWSLKYEFLCYIVVGLLGFIPFFRRSAWAMGLAFVLSVALFLNADLVVSYVGDTTEIRLLLKLLPYFLGGAWLFTLQDRLRYSALYAVPAAVIGLVAIDQSPVHGAQVAAPLLAYALLWLSLVLPAPAVIRKHDVSYGVYIYAFPVQQLTTLFGGDSLPPVLYVVVCSLGTGVLATLSWFLVERPVMQRVRQRRPTPGAGPGGAESGRTAPAAPAAGVSTAVSVEPTLPLATTAGSAAGRPAQGDVEPVAESRRTS